MSFPTSFSQAGSPQISKSILLVDDDKQLCSLMTKYFVPYGFRMQLAHDGRTGLAAALENAFDLIILDVMLPVMDGFDILRQIRKRITTPVIMLTARTAQSDRILGLNLGADDYLLKPFGPEELLARIRAVLRRASNADLNEPQILEVGGLELDPLTRELWCAGEPVELTSIECAILEVLMRSLGRVVTRDELTTVLYQRPATPYERAVDVHICHLRKKLEGNGKIAIRNVRGVGYCFAELTRREG